MSEQARFSAQFKLTNKKTQMNVRRAQFGLRVIAEKLFRERIFKGIDVFGKPFKPYTKEYRRAKERYIRKPRTRGTSNRAREMPSFIRRTGRLMSSVKVVVGGVIIGDTFRFDITFRSDLEYARYIEEQGRNWLGISDKSSPRYKAEVQQLYDAALRGLEFRR